MGTLDAAALRVPCAYCRAEPGAWCRRRNTAGEVTGRASYLHEARQGPVRVGWHNGWAEGVHYAIEHLRHLAGDAHDTGGDVGRELGAGLNYAADRLAASWIARRD